MAQTRDSKSEDLTAHHDHDGKSRGQFEAIEGNGRLYDARRIRTACKANRDIAHDHDNDMLLDVEMTIRV